MMAGMWLCHVQHSRSGCWPRVIFKDLACHLSWLHRVGCGAVVTCSALVYSAAKRCVSMKTRGKHETLELIGTHDMGLASWFQISRVVSSYLPSLSLSFSGYFSPSHLISLSATGRFYFFICIFQFLKLTSGWSIIIFPPSISSLYIYLDFF